MKENFRVIIAGSRNFNDYDLLCKFCDNVLINKKSSHNIIIISGECDGADKLGESRAL